MPRRKALSPDAIRVRHIADAIQETLLFIKNKSRDDLDHDRQLALSLLKEIEIVGEAASKVSFPFRKRYHDIPWNMMIRTRNRLVHGYFDIDLNIVWNTVKEEFPKLLKQIQKIQRHSD